VGKRVKYKAQSTKFKVLSFEMIIEQITVTAFQQHTRIVGCEQTKRAICIDPGDDSAEIVRAIDKHGFTLQAIACTHAHMDHVGGVAGLKKRKPEARIIMHPADEPLYVQLPNQPAWIGIPRSEWTAYGFDYEAPPKVDEYWTDGQTYRVGELSFQVIHCPGHTPGHVVLFEPKEEKVFVGDCLFAGSIGRTDLPGGSTEALMNSIFNKILPLGDDVEVYSGHGPTTTIGYERRTNPFLTAAYEPRGTGRF
jgi:hydroxyacylglutathione hydrolase